LAVAAPGFTKYNLGEG